jgi:hypothetical protein
VCLPGAFTLIISHSLHCFFEVVICSAHTESQQDLKSQMLSRMEILTLVNYERRLAALCTRSNLSEVSLSPLSFESSDK